MNEMITIIARSVAGILLGIFFFGGLWWTVRKAVTAKNPALWFLGSSLLRTAGVLAGFYFIAGGDWKAWLFCLSGFFIARIIVLRFTRSTQETNHAP